MNLLCLNGSSIVKYQIMAIKKPVSTGFYIIWSYVYRCFAARFSGSWDSPDSHFFIPFQLPRTTLSHVVNRLPLDIPIAASTASLELGLELLATITTS